MSSRNLLISILWAWCLLCHSAELPALARLRVSENHRFLVTEDGRPFFWLGDTAWELFHQLTFEEASFYLKNRADKGFTVVQAVALAEINGLTVPNAEGQLPLIDNDPLRPNEAYFQLVDRIVARANSLGLYIGFLPTWGDKWNKKWGAGPEIFTPDNARKYGEWLGHRYRNSGLIWILGGDRPVETDLQKDVLRAMARGLMTGDGGSHLISFHPTGGAGSSDPFHDEDWLDFNMRQNGHNPEFTGHYDKTRADYDRVPVKPVINAEPIYEGHPVSFNARNFGHSVAADVRRPFYWDMFSGAMGHTYGHHSVWSMHAAGRQPINSPLMSWREALDEPGAFQMGIGRRLLELRPILSRIPDDSLLVPVPVPTLVPGAGTRHFAAVRDTDGSFAFVYVPVGRSFQVNLEKLSGEKIRAWWFDPRSGAPARIGEFPRSGTREFTPPTPGELLDWVLVLDDVAKGYPIPGIAR